MDLSKKSLIQRLKYLDQQCYPCDEEILAASPLGEKLAEEYNKGRVVRSDNDLCLPMESNRDVIKTSTEVVKSHKIYGNREQRPPRVVPPFSIQSLQKNTIVQRAPRSKPKKPYPVGQSSFRTYYKRGDFPISMEFDSFGYKVAWRVDLADIDFHYYLPLFFEGLTETEHPYKFFTQHGIHDMLMQGPHKVLPVIPQIILPIKNALNTKNDIVISTTLKVLQDLASSSDDIGHALVPYYRQILPPLNFLKDNSTFDCGFKGDDIDYGQQKRENVQDLIQETLEVLEKHGGRDAFINIKYMIPTYESCIRN